jgi:hypothetical protein
MDSIRMASPDLVAEDVDCCRCIAASGPWDRIVGKPYCPNCQELLALGEADPLIERAEKRHCTICNCVGTVRFTTYPLHTGRAVEMDLCPEHLRALLGRRLGAHAFQQLRRQLARLGVDVTEVFLLHEVFYDTHGRALQPARDVV